MRVLVGDEHLVHGVVQGRLAGVGVEMTGDRKACSHCWRGLLCTNACIITSRSVTPTRAAFLPCQMSFDGLSACNACRNLSKQVSLQAFITAGNEIYSTACTEHGTGGANCTVEKQAKKAHRPRGPSWETGRVECRLPCCAAAPGPAVGAPACEADTALPGLACISPATLRTYLTAKRPHRQSKANGYHKTPSRELGNGAVRSSKHATD